MKLPVRPFMALPLLAIASLPAMAGTVYLDDSLGNLYAGDPSAASPSYTLVGNSAIAASFGGFTDIAFDNGILYGLDSLGNLYSISTADGSITNSLGSTGITDGSLVGLAADSSGNLWAGGAGNVYEIDPPSAVATVVGTGGGGYVTAGDLDFDSSGNLYLTSTTPTSDTLFLINQTTGAGANLGALPYANVFGVAFDSDHGVLWGFEAGDTQFQIDPASPGTIIDDEAFTQVSGTPGALLGAAYLASPEPSTFGLLLAGSALAVFAGRRRKTN